MDNLKQESKYSFKNKYFVIACVAIALIGIALFNIKFPSLRDELSDTLFITALFLTLVNLFQGKK